MATNVLMPKWGMSMQEGLVSCWLKKQGDSVEQGEAIVEDDVQAALKEPPRPGAAPISKVVFYSLGHKLDGILYLPKDYQAGRRLPAVVLCLGFTYLKDLLVPEMARRLSAQGYACLLFDYRGFGKSEGTRGRLIPLEQVSDIQAAVTEDARFDHVMEIVSRWLGQHLSAGPEAANPP